MRLVIIALGRMKDGPERALVARYIGRAATGGRPLGLSGPAIVELAESRERSAEARRREEARAILAQLPENSVLVALDERGKSLSSEGFAGRISQWRDENRTALALVIGGADGLDETVRARADLVLSFSPMTWPHQIVRIMAAEQLYRATTILSGHPYHRGD
ncbi:23S rRNA (pseudouridine(1915)-N(3))-methyltransferase RlmH [Pelagibacterium sediminicola]|uniref:23S rRNA (pseudouridine(1915)-N(3))-methyltransferase RlmH n=1 Tax=Pelagibacterium sediminicola TaxID=2248761 RepID=UPI000E31329D|nr:23S rRNA (pseudouridine(1915)-N(3))-methyltransferase RlmH [Pelagibacterium sediminicola]